MSAWLLVSVTNGVVQWVKYFFLWSNSMKHNYKIYQTLCKDNQNSLLSFLNVCLLWLYSAGAWGNATSIDYNLVQLRALDWETDGPFQQYPVVLVYHPSQEGHSFSVVLWSGLVGAITGYNLGVWKSMVKLWWTWFTIRYIIYICITWYFTIW